MADIFDEVMNLEENFFSEGYDEGWKDGLVAGRAEGRSLGMERGFEKFSEAGRLYGKSVVWSNRLQITIATNNKTEQYHMSEKEKNLKEGPKKGHQSTKKFSSSFTPLPRISDRNKKRLEKHITSVHDLLEPDTLPTKNTDEAVEDVDDRVRRAQGKVRVIERALCEAPIAENSAAKMLGKNENLEESPLNR